MSYLHIQGINKEESMKTNKITAAGLTLFLAFIILVTPVLAATPHIAKAKATGPDDAGNLTVSFSVSGVGKYSWTSVIISGDSEAFYACKPAEGNFQPGTIPERVSTSINIGLELTPVKGSVAGSSIIPPPGIDLQCEAGTVATLALITYSNLVLTTIYYGSEWPMFDSKSIQGTFSATYYGYTP
jgi:hypothetical protein